MFGKLWGAGIGAALIPDWDNAPVGRHSAPDDGRGHAPAPVAVARPGVPRGRHSHPDEGNDDTTRAETGTHADLRLMREIPGLRSRCVAAVIVPFLLYTAALVVIARTDVYLLWLWIPTVTAGIAVGTFLDVEHRRRR